MSIVRFIGFLDEIRAVAVHDATAAPALRKAFHWASGAITAAPG
jgi:hypothetical protein